MLPGPIIHPRDFKSSMAGLGDAGKSRYVQDAHPNVCLGGLHRAGTPLRSLAHRVPEHVVVHISHSPPLHLPASLSVSSSMSLAHLCLCHCVHICLSVALLVFKGPEFI